MIMAAPPVVMAYGEVKQHVTRAQLVLKYQGRSRVLRTKLMMMMTFLQTKLLMMTTRMLMVTRAQLVLKYQGHHFLTDKADDDENLFFA